MVSFNFFIDSGLGILYPRYRSILLTQLSVVTSQFQLSGLTCESCVKLIKRKLGKLNGVQKVILDLSGKTEIVASQPILKETVSAVLAGTDYQIFDDHNL